MIPRTYPTSYNSSTGWPQMRAYKLSSVTGLTRWVDYIPIKTTGTVEGSYSANGFIAIESLSSTTGLQSWVDYVPVYEDASATVAWECSGVGFIPVGASAGAEVPAYPQTPIADIWAMDASSTGGRYVPNRLFLGTSSSNLISLSSGQILGASFGTSSSTENFANGPKGLLTAKRIQLPASGDYYQLFSTVLPAGTYTMNIKVKNNAVGTSPAFQFCDFTATGTGSTTTTATDSGFTTKALTLTANGSAAQQVIIRNSSGTSTDLLIDEIQLYEGASVPSYSSEVLNDGALRPLVGYSSRLPMSGNAINLSAGGITSNIRFPSYPLTTSNSALTFVGVFSTADAATVAAKLLSMGDGTGVFDISTSQGNAYGAPALPQTNPVGLLMASKGYHILTARFKATEQSVFFHEVEVARTVAAMSAVVRSYATALTDTNGSFGFKGKFTNLQIYDRWLTDSEVYQAVARARAVHLRHAETAAGSGFNIILAEGDSITSSGSAYWRQYITAGQTNIYAAGKAVSGSTMTDVNTRQTAILKNITEAKINGNYPIVSLLIGANGVPTISDLQTYWSAIRAAGAKVVACTMLPNAGQPAGFETARTALNTQIRAASSSYDALADFGGDATMGVSNSFTATPANWTDSTHPSAAGHAILMPIFQTAVNSIKV